MASQVALVVKNLPASAADIRDAGSILGSGRSPEEGHDTLLSMDVSLSKLQETVKDR